MSTNLAVETFDFDELRAESAPADLMGIERAPQISRFSQIGERYHYRLEYASSFAIGHSEICWLSEGMFLQTLDAALAYPLRVNVRGPDTLRIRIGTGISCYQANGGPRLSLSGPSVCIIAEPRRVTPASAFLAGRQRSVNLCVHRSALARLYAGALRDLPPPLYQMVTGELSETFVHAAPITGLLSDCMTHVMDCDLDGHSRWLFLQSKAVEILCRALEMLATPARFDVTPVMQRAVAKAQTILDRQFVSPPTLDALAVAVGLSRSGLCAGFKSVTGKSVHDYVLDLRMRKAMTMLRSGEASVAEIARAIGYNHASSFSAVVQKFFGTSPRAIRRQVSPTGRYGY